MQKRVIQPLSPQAHRYPEQGSVKVRETISANFAQLFEKVC